VGSRCCLWVPTCRRWALKTSLGGYFGHSIVASIEGGACGYICHVMTGESSGEDSLGLLVVSHLGMPAGGECSRSVPHFRNLCRVEQYFFLFFFSFLFETKQAQGHLHTRTNSTYCLFYSICDCASKKILKKLRVTMQARRSLTCVFSFLFDTDERYLHSKGTSVRASPPIPWTLTQPGKPLASQVQWDGPPIASVPTPPPQASHHACPLCLP
jgi:hypothetical protein